MKLSEEVATEIRAEMGRQRQSANRLEAELGWPRTYLGRRLRGEVSFNLDEVEAIARALEVPVTSFFPDGHRGQLRKQPAAALAVAA